MNKEFSCECCNYTTQLQSNYSKHIRTDKHKKNSNQVDMNRNNTNDLSQVIHTMQSKIDHLEKQNNELKEKLDIIIGMLSNKSDTTIEHNNEAQPLIVPSMEVNNTIENESDVIDDSIGNEDEDENVHPSVDRSMQEREQEDSKDDTTHNEIIKENNDTTSTSCLRQDLELSKDSCTASYGRSRSIPFGDSCTNMIVEEFEQDIKHLLYDNKVFEYVKDEEKYKEKLNEFKPVLESKMMELKDIMIQLTKTDKNIVKSLIKTKLEETYALSYKYVKFKELKRFYKHCEFKFKKFLNIEIYDNYYDKLIVNPKYIKDNYKLIF